MATRPSPPSAGQLPLNTRTPTTRWTMQPTGTWTLRPARLTDAVGMADMSRVLIEAGLGWRYTAPRMAALIGDPDTTALVAVSGARFAALAGLAVMQFGDSTAHLALLCIQPSQQRQGLGRQLVDWLLASARVAGIGSVRLELRADNAAALSFYRRLGFVETAWLCDYYEGQIAARRMQLALRPIDADRNPLP